MLEIVSLKGFEKRKTGPALRRPAAARGHRPGPGEQARRSCCWTSLWAPWTCRLRKDMQNELKRIQQQLGITFIYVTHDQEEALAMSDTVVVMDKAAHPADRHARGHLQRAEKRLRRGFHRRDATSSTASCARTTWWSSSAASSRCLDQRLCAKDEPVDVVIRPEDVDIVPPDSGHLCGTVTSVTFKGVHYDTIVDFKGFKWLIQTTDLHRPARIHRHKAHARTTYTS